MRSVTPCLCEVFRHLIRPKDSVVVTKCSDLRKKFDFRLRKGVVSQWFFAGPFWCVIGDFYGEKKGGWNKEGGGY